MCYKADVLALEGELRVDGVAPARRTVGMGWRGASTVVEVGCVRREDAGRFLCIVANVVTGDDDKIEWKNSKAEMK